MLTELEKELVEALEKIRNEPSETLSDAKALREIMRITKAALAKAKQAESEPEIRTVRLPCANEMEIQRRLGEAVRKCETLCVLQGVSGDPAKHFASHDCAESIRAAFPQYFEEGK